jgi:hypothetical protein
VPLSLAREDVRVLYQILSPLRLLLLGLWGLWATRSLVHNPQTIAR